MSFWSILRRTVALRVYRVAQDGYERCCTALQRISIQDNPRVESIARDIIADVRTRGDAALLELGRKFDSPDLHTLEVPRDSWAEAADQIAPDMRAAVDAAAANIRSFHDKQKRQTWMDAQPGQITGQIIRPLKRVGIYAPAGTAPLSSTVLMTVIPAAVAGVDEIILCIPVQRDGKVPPLMLYAAHVAGAHRLFTVGGAQAMAALAFGTESVPRVDKIAGPANIYGTVAKKLLWGIVDIDMLAGPSEVCVVADAQANPVFAALDLLTQAEHDAESAAFLITPSETLAQAVLAEVEQQMERLPRRDILRKSLRENSAVLITESLAQAFDLVNVCAPEHLALMVRDPFAALGHIRNAGAILMGDYTPQTLGDYLAGPSHTLPTGGTARFASPLNVDTFLKKSSFIYYTADALNQVADTLTTFAHAEGFEAHAEAVNVRTKYS